jgi:D-methionine transport system substrate-binding protein
MWTKILTALAIATTSAHALKVGVTAGPHAIIMEKIKEIAAQKGLAIEPVEFNDFILPNAALDQNDLQANSYQHEPFLAEQVKSRGYKIASIAKTVVMPLGAYAHQIKDIKELKDGAKVAIPNDPTNGSRALKLLEKQGLIKLKKADIPSLLDVQDNPKKLNFIELEAPQLPRSLEEVDLAIINTDWVLLAGLDPSKALFTESKDSPYANVIAVRAEDVNKDEIQNFVKIYQSDEIKSFIQEKFKGAVIAAW